MNTITLTEVARPRRTGTVVIGFSLLVALAALAFVPWFTSFATQRLLVEVFTVFAIMYGLMRTGIVKFGYRGG